MSTTLDQSFRLAPAHRGGVAIVPLGLALSIFMAVSFLLCALGGFLPGLENLHFLGALYPSLDWTSPALIVAGAAWAFACGWYVAVFCGLLYNIFSGRRT
jgi:hypothetical protein